MSKPALFKTLHKRLMSFFFLLKTGVTRWFEKFKNITFQISPYLLLLPNCILYALACHVENSDFL